MGDISIRLIILVKIMIMKMIMKMMIMKMMIMKMMIMKMIMIIPLSALISIICDTNDDGSMRSATQLIIMIMIMIIKTIIIMIILIPANNKINWATLCERLN